MSKFIVSTLDASTEYAIFGDSPRRVLVLGVAGLRLVGRGAPPSMRTEVSDEEAAFLSNHDQFIEHQKRGHVRIEDSASDSDYGRIA